MTIVQRTCVILAALGLLFSLPAAGLESKTHTPIIDFRERFLPTAARNGMVVAPEKLAAQIGLDILQRGGNAIDAAVATGFALAVSYPRAGNLAGGGFMLVHLAEENRQLLIDYRETAPTGASRDMFLDEKGELDRRLAGRRLADPRRDRRPRRAHRRRAHPDGVPVRRGREWRRPRLPVLTKV